MDPLRDSATGVDDFVAGLRALRDHARAVRDRGQRRRRPLPVPRDRGQQTAQAG